MTKEQILENLKNSAAFFDSSFYRTVAENAQDAIFILNPDFCVMYVNSYGSDLFGLNQEQIIGKNIQEIFRPADYEILHNSLQKVTDSGQSLYKEQKINFHGQEFFLGTRCVPIKDKQGKIIKILGYCRNISQSKKISQDLELERKQLISIFEGMDQAVYIADPNTYEILYCNRALADSLANPVGLVAGQKCYRILHNLDSPCLFCTNDKILGENIGKPYIWEFQNITNQRWYHCIDKAMRWTDGRMVRYEIAIDITENKEQTKILRLNEARYRTVIDNQTELICRWSLDQKLNFVNDAYCRYFNKTPQELIGKSFMSLIPQEDWAKVEEHFKTLTIENPVLMHEHRVISSTGQVCWMQWVNRAIFDQGRIIEFQAVGRDITESKKMSERLDKINKCFLEFGHDGQANIHGLVTLCGELLGADCVLYNRFEQGMLCCLDQWNAPSDFCLQGRADGHICLDVINRAKDQPTILRHLQQTDYARTDPNVNKYQLQTYIGHAVQFAGQSKGVVCAVYKSDYAPTPDDQKSISIIASAIAVEEERKSQQDLIKEKELFASDIFASIQDGISVLDQEMNILQVNPAMEKWYAHAMPIVGKKCYEVYHGRLEPCQICPSRRSLQSGQPCYEVVAKRGLGSEIIGWQDLYSFPFFDTKTGAIRGVIEYVRDISERKKAEEELSKRINLERIISQITTSFINITADKVDEGINQALQIIGEFLGVDSSNILLLSKDGRKAFNTYEWNSPHILDSQINKLQEIPVDRFTWFIKKLKARENVYIDNINNLPLEVTAEKEFFESYFVKSLIIIPMLYEDRLIGSLSFNTVNEEKEFSGEAIGLLKIAAEMFANALARKRKEEELKNLNQGIIKSNERLKQLALRDPHTGLFNHHYLEEIMDTEFHRARRYALPFSVIMLDIDYFKSINDVYGHKFGDLVLKQFAKQLKKLVRRYDIAVRFGGEEFVIVSPGSDKSTALMLSERILDAVGLFNFGNKRHTVKLKLSIAVVSYPQDKVAKGMSLVELADKIVDKIKEKGGNSVCCSSIIKGPGYVNIKDNLNNSDIGFLRKSVAKLTKKANQNLIEAVFAFAKTIEVKDHYTGDHVERTVQYATEIAKIMHLAQDEIELIRQAAILHDLGKIGISERILHKRSALTTQEFNEIKKHPQIGVDIIRPIQFLRYIIPSVLYHHERWDGKGYPSGLKGEEIPLGARIVAIADVYQALGSDRPYRKAFSPDKVIEIINAGSGTQFDPQIVSSLMKIIRQ